MVNDSVGIVKQITYCFVILFLFTLILINTNIGNGETWNISVHDEWVLQNHTQAIETTYNGHFYQLIHSSMTWNEAKTDCEQQGGYLATITSQAENDHILDMINPYSYTIWIGFTDEETEGDWQWITGETVLYTNWWPDEPNDAGIGEDYVEMDGSGRWNDNGAPSDPSLVHYFVCEWDSHDLSTPTIVFPNGGEVLKGTVPVNWSASIDSLGHSVSYEVLFSTDNGTVWNSIVSGLTTTHSGISMIRCIYNWDTTELTSGTTFLIKVVATCSEGVTTEDVSDEIFTVHYLTAPTINNLSRTIKGLVTIQWAASIDSLNQNVTYSLYYSSDRGSTWKLLASGLTVKVSYNWNTTTVSDGRNYLIKVVATSFDGLSKETIFESTFTIDNIAQDKSFLIFSIAIVAVIPELYIGKKLSNFVKRQGFEGGEVNP